jgi:hypothetical protein
MPAVGRRWYSAVLRPIGLYPSPDATGIDEQASLGRKFSNVRVRERIPQVPPDRVQDHLPGYCRPLNASVGVIGIDFLPYQTDVTKSQRNLTGSALRRSMTGCILNGKPKVDVIIPSPSV